MKRFIITLMLALGLCLTVSAQTYRYQTKQLAIASINQYTGKYTWSDWSDCVLNIYIDFDEEMIYINSNTPQRYKIVECGEWQNDPKGGKTIQMKVVDQDFDRAVCRLRIDPYGIAQIYIDWADIAYVYSGLRRY